jgi:hypothetical protein
MKLRYRYFRVSRVWRSNRTVVWRTEDGFAGWVPSEAWPGFRCSGSAREVFEAVEAVVINGS